MHSAPPRSPGRELRRAGTIGCRLSLHAATCDDDHHPTFTHTLHASITPTSCSLFFQELLDLLKLDPTGHMWYCLFCEETIPSAPLRYGFE
jgi:hypothetical protein